MTLQLDPLVCALVVILVGVWIVARVEERRIQATRIRRQHLPPPDDAVLASILRDIAGDADIHHVTTEGRKPRDPGNTEH